MRPEASCGNPKRSGTQTFATLASLSLQRPLACFVTFDAGVESPCRWTTWCESYLFNKNRKRLTEHDAMLAFFNEVPKQADTGYDAAEFIESL